MHLRLLGEEIESLSTWFMDGRATFDAAFPTLHPGWEVFWVSLLDWEFGLATLGGIRAGRVLPFCKVFRNWWRGLRFDRSRICRRWCIFRITHFDVPSDLKKHGKSEVEANRVTKHRPKPFDDSKVPRTSESRCDHRT